jgi:hypothetical protein
LEKVEWKGLIQGEIELRRSYDRKTTK